MKYCNSRLFLTLLITSFLTSQPAFAMEKLLVYAAASTSSAITEIIEQFKKASPEIEIKTSFASSSTLAKQIEAGAPAQIYISANPKWMDYLQRRKLIVTESRRDLLSNKVALISPQGKGFTVKMSQGFDLAGKLGDGKLCLGDPGHVPAGIYAKQALLSLAWWDKVESSVVGTKDVRAALVLVERGECAAGIVYSTDARFSKKIELIAEFPAGSHSPVVYPVAVLVSAPDLAHTFLNYLGTPQAKAIFKKYGFNTRP